MSDNPLIYLIAGFGGGIYLFYKGFIWLKQKRLIENIPTSKVRALAMGLAEIYGEAKPSQGKLIKSHLYEKDCVYYRYTVEEYRSTGKSSHWVIVDQGEDSVPFFLEDETGDVLVDPKGAKVDIKTDYQYTGGSALISFNKNNNANTNIKPVLLQKAEAAADQSGSKWVKMLVGGARSKRYTEYIIMPGDKLYIMGTAGKNPFVDEGTAQNSAEGIMIQKGANDKFYYIADKPEKDILRGLKLKSFGGIVGGALLSVGSLAGILLYTGIFFK